MSTVIRTYRVSLPITAEAPTLTYLGNDENQGTTFTPKRAEWDADSRSVRVRAVVIADPDRRDYRTKSFTSPDVPAWIPRPDRLDWFRLCEAAGVDIAETVA